MQNKTEGFIKKSMQIHGDKYDYYNVKYVNNKTKVCIICPEHGEFLQEPRHHLSGHGCPQCGKEISNKKQTSSINDFIEKSKQIHNGKYNYEKTKYVNSDTKVCIICPTHGEFWQTPHSHLRGQGCPQCGRERNIESIRITKDEFIKRGKKIHNDKYNYSKVNFINIMTKVCIICPIHGEFWQTPINHLQGHGCSICGKINKTNNILTFIKNSNNIHFGKYDYSKVNYINNQNKVCIICPEHGEFWQRPDNHIKGQGCPRCSSSHMENEIRNLLNTNNVIFEEQKKFDWLGLQSLDFYLPDYNIAIECQGIQHFKPIVYFGSYEAFKFIQERDKLKKQLCEKNKIKMLYYVNYKYDFPYDVITDKNEILKLLKCHENH